MSLSLVSNTQLDNTQLQPREKLREYGTDALNDSELLALILGTGYKKLPVQELSQHLLSEFGTKGIFQFSDLQSIQKNTGLPFVKSCTILAISEFLRRITKKDNTKIQSSEQLYNYVKDSLKNSTFERLHIVCIDSQRRVLYSGLIAQGNGKNIQVDLLSIFHHPIRLNCSNFYLAHNHPFGVSEPSKEDIHFTETVKGEAQKLGLSFDDHIIVGEENFYSFALSGVL